MVIVGLLMLIVGVPLAIVGAVETPMNWTLVLSGGGLSLIGLIVLAAKLGIFTVVFEMLGGILDALLLVRWPLRRRARPDEHSTPAR